MVHLETYWWEDWLRIVTLVVSIAAGAGLTMLLIDRLRPQHVVYLRTPVTHAGPFDRLGLLPTVLPFEDNCVQPAPRNCIPAGVMADLEPEPEVVDSFADRFGFETAPAPPAAAPAPVVAPIPPADLHQARPAGPRRRPRRQRRR